MAFKGHKIKYLTRSEHKRTVQLILPNKLLVMSAHAHNKVPTLNGRCELNFVTVTLMTLDERDNFIYLLILVKCYLYFDDLGRAR